MVFHLLQWVYWCLWQKSQQWDSRIAIIPVYFACSRLNLQFPSQSFIFKSKKLELQYAMSLSHLIHDLITRALNIVHKWILYLYHIPCHHKWKKAMRATGIVVWQGKTLLRLSFFLRVRTMYRTKISPGRKMLSCFRRIPRTFVYILYSEYVVTFSSKKHYCMCYRIGYGTVDFQWGSTVHFGNRIEPRSIKIRVGARGSTVVMLL